MQTTDRPDLELLEGAIDIHTHTAPDLFPRQMDNIECAEQAKGKGMRAVVQKFHHGVSADRIYFVKREVAGIDVLGGIVLNNAVGGLNPYAVETAIKSGASIVWMPTISSKNHLDQFGQPGFPAMKQVRSIRMKEKPITVFDEEGRLVPEIYDIVDLIADADIALATGHLSPPEVTAVLKVAKERGVKRLLVNHPEYIVNGSIEEQRAWARMGAFIEHLVIFMMPAWHHYSPAQMAQMTREVGPEHVIMATDLGQIHNPPPVEGLRMFIQLMLENGIPYADVKRMVQDNPAALMGLD
jgi:hypothetical protein